MARNTSQKHRKPRIKKEVCRVHSVYDGDTMTVERVKYSWLGFRKHVRLLKIRLAYIDTPELRYQEPGAQNAKEVLDNLITGKPVMLEYEVLSTGVPRTGSFNRILAVVHLQRMVFPNININELLLRKGLARLYRNADNITPHYRRRFAKAERYAQRKHLGIWRQSQDQPSQGSPTWLLVGTGIAIGIVIGLLLL